MKGFTEEKTHKISLFCALSALRDNCALLINDYSRLIVGLLLSIKILFEHNLYVHRLAVGEIDFWRYSLPGIFYSELQLQLIDQVLSIWSC